ncbi:MAG: acyl-CoA dehydrogenase family protein [Candidatus Thorarchaeota archaeon]
MIQDIKNILQTCLPKDEFELGESILDMVDEVCSKDIEPFMREIDETGTRMENGKVIIHPQIYKVVETFKKNDMFGLTIPEKYNGSGINSTISHGVGERIAQADLSISSYMGLQQTITDFLMTSGTEELREKFLPELAEGKRFGGLLLTEPQSGSDLGSVKTRAVRDGDRYLINGQKIFITNAHIADTFVFLASSDPSKGRKGLTAFVLDAKNQPGFKVERVEHKMGIRASPTGTILLDNVEIPIENRIGEEGHGFSKVLNGLSASRIGVAAGATGVAEAAYRKAIQYARERVQFGQTILTFQANQFKIADMATKIHLARMAYIHASRLKDMKEDFNTAASIAKLFASEMAQEVTYEAIQLHGGYGFIVEYDVEKYYRDIRITTLYEGTSEVQREIISRNEIRRSSKE